MVNGTVWIVHLYGQLQCHRAIVVDFTNKVCRCIHVFLVAVNLNLIAYISMYTSMHMCSDTPLLQWPSEPLASPQPYYDKERDTIMCTAAPKYGMHVHSMMYSLHYMQFLIIHVIICIYI
jgi:hypothetical protein